jgi:hypothetical protein
MASGHGYRANRPNTWLLRPVKKALANLEPSAPSGGPGLSARCLLFRGEADLMCST